MLRRKREAVLRQRGEDGTTGKGKEILGYSDWHSACDCNFLLFVCVMEIRLADKSFLKTWSILKVFTKFQ